MTTKKTKTIQQRAHAIINSSTRRYDEDTRHSIENALRSDAADLKECVIRAERGETILDVSTPPHSEFAPGAREANIARRGCPLDYDREAAQLAAYMASDETPEAVKNLIIDYLAELSSTTKVGVWTPSVLRVAYPIMRFRDGASDGARVLLGIAIKAVTNEQERATLREVWEAARERLDARTIKAQQVTESEAAS